MTGELERVLKKRLVFMYIERVTCTTFHLFKSLLVDFCERVVLLFQLLDAASERNGDFQIMAFQLVGVARFGIIQRRFHLLDCLDDVMRLLSQLTLFTSEYQRMSVLIDGAVLTQ